MQFIEKIISFCYNILKKKERIDDYMTLKKMTAQISIFLKDGIMNPSKYKKNINEIFNDLFSKEILSINIDGAPDDMPLVRCTSKDNMLSYDFSRKRINFAINFTSKNKLISFDDYKNKVLELITNDLLSVTDISRIGIAFVYYCDVEDKNNNYWINKYSFPFASNSTSQLSYTINNSFEKNAVKFNNIINLSNASIDGKNFPIVSVDLNNVPNNMLTEEQITFILTKCSNYSIDSVSKLLNDDEQ